MTDSTLPANRESPAGSSGGDVKAEAGTQDEVHQAVRKLAEAKPSMLAEFLTMETFSGGNPLHQKMTQEHISQVLDLAAKRDERQYNLHATSQDNAFIEGKSIRAYGFSAFVLLLILTGVVLVIFKDKPDVLIPILTGLGGIVGGFLGGWGFGKRQD